MASSLIMSDQCDACFGGVCILLKMHEALMGAKKNLAFGFVFPSQLVPRRFAGLQGAGTWPGQRLPGVKRGLDFQSDGPVWTLGWLCAAFSGGYFDKE